MACATHEIYIKKKDLDEKNKCRQKFSKTELWRQLFQVPEIAVQVVF